eukprot:6265367-Amphidinium_carterae.1
MGGNQQWSLSALYKSPGKRRTLADFRTTKLPLAVSLREAAQDRSSWKRLVCDLFLTEDGVDGSNLAGLGGSPLGN